MAKPQSFKNHVRYHPFYHYFLLPLSMGCLIHSGIQIARSPQDHLSYSILMFLIFFLLFCVISLIRLYVLKVQNRIILMEENFRYVQLTGKQLDPKLRTSQIIALRFASDQEFPDLASRAIHENLKAIEIKKAIKQWRPDYKRI